MEFYKLNIKEVKRPVKNVTSLVFDIPEHLTETFEYWSGQHLTFKFMINGEEYRRSYSLNSCPLSEYHLEVSVKRVKNGIVSNYINNHLKAGDEVEITYPQGNFQVEINADNYKSYYLFAAGSGITPIFSMVKSILYYEPKSTVALLYGNKNRSSILFYEELEYLQQQFPDRLKVQHTLSNRYSDWNAVMSWDGKEGRIDEAMIEAFFRANPPFSQNTEYFICGPGEMNQTIKKALQKMDVSAALIHIEHFGGNITGNPIDIVGVDAELLVRMNGNSYSAQLNKDETILQALKKQQISVPYSCESGVCGTCLAQLKSGKVEMKANMILEEKDVKVGKILCCQAIPKSDKIEIEL